MKERPILFSAPMVRAIHDGSKTQTRRVVKPQPIQSERFDGGAYMPQPKRTFTARQVSGDIAVKADYVHLCCPYGQPGDRLLVAMEIPGASRNYSAGSDGQIYSRARGSWRPLNTHGNSNGYPSVTIMDGGRKTTRAVHSLVCAAFYGRPPFDGAQVRHLNGDADNSAPGNLAWGSQAENWLDRRSHGNGIEGEKHHAAKFSNDERSHILWAIEKGLCSERGAARALGVAQSTIQKMRSNWALPADPVMPDTRIPVLILEIVSVRVERLHEISTEAIIAEGLSTHLREFDAECDLHEQWRQLWESINGPANYDANPWVWVVEFKKVES